MVPFVITECFTNATVNLQYGLTKTKYNIRWINPYKSDLNIEDNIPEICITMSIYDRQLYNVVLYQILETKYII